MPCSPDYSSECLPGDIHLDRSLIVVEIFTIRQTESLKFIKRQLYIITR